eukprot:31882_1
MLLTIGFLQYLYILGITCTRQTSYNVSFELSIIFNGHSTFKASPACNHYFGSAYTTMNTIKSMKDIFQSSLPYFNTSIAPSNITQFQVELDNYTDNIDCKYMSNTVVININFVWLVGDFESLEDYIDDFYVTSAIKLNTYFNETASLIYSHQTMQEEIIYENENSSSSYPMIIITVITSLICMIGVILCIFQHIRNNKKTFVVDQALVLIIGITKFDGKNNLSNDVYNISNLKRMWTQKYGYDVFVSPKHCSKSKLIQFIDQHKCKLQNIKYKAVIVHIITHGIQNDSFLTSDLKNVNMNYIRHEWMDAQQTLRNGSPLMKFIFYHGCRGEEFVKPGEMINIQDVQDNHGCCTCNCFKNIKEKKVRLNSLSMKNDDEENSHTRISMRRDKSSSRAGDNTSSFLYSHVEISHKEKSVTAHAEYEYSHRNSDEAEEDVLELRGACGLLSTNNNNSNEISAESNMVTIYGTIAGHALSTNGFFATCICDAFEKNADKYLYCSKKDFVSIIMEIGFNLEKITNHCQMCTTSGIGSIRFRHVRFDPCKIGLSKLKKESNDDLFDDEEGDDTFDDSLFDHTEITESQKRLAASAMQRYNVIKNDCNDRKKIDVIATKSAVDLHNVSHSPVYETHLKPHDYSRDFQTRSKYLLTDTDESIKTSTPMVSFSHDALSSSHGQTALLTEIRLIEAHHNSVSSDIFDVPLIQEIIRNENEWRQYIKQHPGSRGSYGKSSSGRNSQKNNSRNESRKNSEKSNEKSNTNDDNKDDKEKKEEKDDDEGDGDGDGVFDMHQIDKILAKVEQLKNHPKYKIMEKHNHPLLDSELIALVYYTDSSSACHKMKLFHRALTNVRKWKQLYYHATNGVKKLHRVFHYKNKQQPKIMRLYHGSTIESFDKLSQEQLFLKTLFSFSKQFAVASTFATGSIW